MRTNLKVPFAEKDEAKKLGARWDAARKLWYVENKADLSAFARWSPSPHDASAPAPAAVPRSSGRKMQAESLVIVGSHYRVCSPVCDCPPWEVCPRCADVAFSRTTGSGAPA